MSGRRTLREERTSGVKTAGWWRRTKRGKKEELMVVEGEGVEERELNHFYGTCGDGHERRKRAGS